ncbi:MAG: hypothetical protein Q7J31_16430, partial [Syntrophales bacterium]|nr:hypothetical protein [Syntrophales bacterium]
MFKNRLLSFIAAFGLTFSGSVAFAGEADINLPDLSTVIFIIAGGPVAGLSILYWGVVICATGM